MSPHRSPEIIQPPVQRSHGPRKQATSSPPVAEIRVHRLLAMERDEPPCRQFVLLFPEQHIASPQRPYLQRLRSGEANAFYPGVWELPNIMRRYL